MSQDVILISAMSSDRVIGSGTGMPWNVPAEYQQYLSFVTGHPVIMGRKTWQIFGKDLSDDTPVTVVTRQSDLNGATTADSLTAALDLAGSLDDTVFVAGGGTIYEQALPHATSMYLSEIKGSYEGDTWFPAFDTSEWSLQEERDEQEFVFRHWERITPPEDL